MEMDLKPLFIAVENERHALSFLIHITHKHFQGPSYIYLDTDVHTKLTVIIFFMKQFWIGF